MPNHGNLLDNENCSFTEDNLDNVCWGEAVDACGDGGVATQIDRYLHLCEQMYSESA